MTYNYCFFVSICIARPGDIVIVLCSCCCTTPLAAATQGQRQIDGFILLNLAVADGVIVLEHLARKHEPLLLWRRPIFELDEAVDVNDFGILW